MLNPSRLFNVVLGTILVVGSAFFGWAPDPGMLTFVVGLGMIAGEFRFAARFLDWAEIRVEKFWQAIIEVWRSSISGRALILAVVLVLVTVTIYGAYYLVFRG